MIALLIVLGYLLPILPVSRRMAYVLARTQGFSHTTPARKITRSVSPGYVYVNQCVNRTEEVCQNCGGGKSTHPGQIHASLGRYNNHSDYSACAGFVPWDGKRSEWTPIKVADHSGFLIVLAIGLSVFYPLLIAIEVTRAAYKVIDPDWTEFAKPYHGVESRRERADREARESKIRISELEAKIASQEKELGIGNV